ncbi:MAG TPA: hypothetical protein VFS54_02375, partial [Solirubrobacterales bacterium]|nr:hypothetical protein [Solirubrobacterales bacterium]
MKYPVVVVVVALGLLTVSAAVASAATQHWYTEGFVKGKLVPVGSTATPVTATATSTFHITYAVSGYTDDIECQTAGIGSSVRNPADGSAGVLQSTFAFSGCKSLKHPTCIVKNEQVNTPTLLGLAEEGALGKAVTYGSPAQIATLNLQGAQCLFGGGAFELTGKVTSVLVPGSESEYEFVKTTPSQLKLGGSAAYLTGRYKISKEGRPVIMAP